MRSVAYGDYDMYRCGNEVIIQTGGEDNLVTLINNVAGISRPNVHLNTVIISIRRPIAYRDGVQSRYWPIFFVARPIRAGEELRTFYGAEYWSTREQFSYSAQRLAALTRLNNDATEAFDLASVPVAQLAALRAQPGDGSALRGLRGTR